MKIDAHQHFWKYDPIRDSWITEAMEVIRRNFLPQDLQPLLQQHAFDGCVAVQASQSEEETLFLLDLADKFDFIKGVVGWVDLRDQNIAARLEYFSRFSKLKGFRHVVQAEPEDDFLLREDFCRGIALLHRFGFTYDILIYPRHLKYAIEFAKQFPNQPFVLDHLAKPFIKQKLVNGWMQDMHELSKLGNVHCKISGLVTEADWQQWQAEDFKVYIDVAMEYFGPERVMFGSDWPACLPAADYAQVCELVEQHTSSLSANEKAMLWGLNAARFYQL
ncbi:MAG TPA: amidohydrolase family protein [Chitinophagaceae bacterium]|nr:amidohydrolase family protein [Chitinophagaceae bacterium]